MGKADRRRFQILAGIAVFSGLRPGVAGTLLVACLSAAPGLPAQASSCSPPAGLFDHWVGPQAPTLIFVSGANPYPGELPTLRRKCRQRGRNLAAIHPGTDRLAEASDLLGRLLGHVVSCVEGEVTVLCSSKGCDAVSESLAGVGPQTRIWPLVHVAMVNPLIPGAAKAWKIAGGWVWEIHPEHPNRRRLFGAGVPHLARARSLVALRTEGDLQVSDPEDYGGAGSWVAPDETLRFSKDHRDNRRSHPVDLENLALQWGTDVSQLKDDVIYGPASAHGVPLFLEDLLERLEALRRAARPR